MKSSIAGSIMRKRRSKKNGGISRRVSKAASELGRLGGLGGLVGGPARAEALTQKRRTEIARNAANVRWGNVTMRMI